MPIVYLYCTSGDMLDTGTVLCSAERCTCQTSRQVFHIPPCPSIKPLILHSAGNATGSSNGNGLKFISRCRSCGLNMVRREQTMRSKTRHRRAKRRSQTGLCIDGRPNQVERRCRVFVARFPPGSSLRRRGYAQTLACQVLTNAIH